MVSLHELRQGDWLTGRTRSRLGGGVHSINSLKPFVSFDPSPITLALK